MMEEGLLSWYQAMQLAALGPCLFILFFLCVTARNIKKIVVPILYFLSRSCSFILPLADTIGFNPHVTDVLVIGKNLTVALSFLLIIEFITGNVPPLIYWGILAIPLVGASSILYVSMISKEEVCLYNNLCATPAIFKQLYDIFSSSFIFLLLVFLYDRLHRTTNDNPEQKQHKYGIIISLIILNLAILAVKLLYVGGYVAVEQARLAVTIARMGFIYLVLTFIFRLFDRNFDIAYERIPNVVRNDPLNDREQALAETVKKMLAEQKIYRTMELSREGLAKKLAVTENQLSRVINKSFQQNFNSLVNSYRVEEAKDKLLNKDLPITNIAFDVGFNSIPSFNRVFKQVTGYSPTEYRNMVGAYSSRFSTGK